MQGCSSDVLRSVNGTASKCPFLATATEECCPARGTLAGHFTRRLSPSPMPGKRIQQQLAYLPLKRSSPCPQFYRSDLPMAVRLGPLACPPCSGSLAGGTLQTGFTFRSKSLYRRTMTSPASAPSSCHPCVSRETGRRGRGFSFPSERGGGRPGTRF